jgi:Family of unknown function (DUF6228)
LIEISLLRLNGYEIYKLNLEKMQIQCTKNFDTHLSFDRSPAQLQQIEAENLRISIKSNHINVWHWTICQMKSLNAFFQEMSRQWKGWEGEILFSSENNDFELKSSSDLLGHILVKINISEQNRNYNMWKLETFITIQAGQLEKIANDMESFLTKD